MSYGDPDVYYQPEKFGLTILDEIDDPQACYSFDMLVVWRHEDGRLFWAQDGGCSCPSPFEDYTSLDSLDEITDESWAAFEEAVKAHCMPYDFERINGQVSTVYKPERDTLAADKTQMLATVALALKAAS